MITVVGGTKGGTGKSTTAINLTVLLSQAGKKVLLVDADEQTTSSIIVNQRIANGTHCPWVTLRLTGKDMHKRLLELEPKYDHIIIDVGGRDTNSQRSSLCVADKYVIPFRPRSLDLWSTEDINKMLDDVLEGNKNLKIYAFINQADTSGKENEKALEYLKQNKRFICLELMVANRKGFGYSLDDGLGINEMKKKDKKAVQEMTDLYKCIYR